MPASPEYDLVEKPLIDQLVGLRWMHASTRDKMVALKKGLMEDILTWRVLVKQKSWSM